MGTTMGFRVVSLGESPNMSTLGRDKPSHTYESESVRIVLKGYTHNSRKPQNYITEYLYIHFILSFLSWPPI